MMFVVLCYDIGVKRNSKVMKVTKKFLRPVQKSVYEGFITENKLNKLCRQLKNIIDPQEDMVVVYKYSTVPDLGKMSIGLCKKNEDFIL